jgi:hypothetical protein
MTPEDEVAAARTWDNNRAMDNEDTNGHLGRGRNRREKKGGGRVMA